jgi:hypothetical protein
MERSRSRDAYKAKQGMKAKQVRAWRVFESRAGG